MRAFAAGWSWVLLLAASGFSAPARAQFTLFETGHSSLALGGYVRTLSGLFDMGYSVPGMDRQSGFNAEVGRLEWTLKAGERVILQVHDRFQSQISSSATGFGGSVAGIGVSVVPGRSVDLSTVFIDKDRLRVWHDVDRLALTVYTGIGDLTVGRQAITWGISNLFPVADLWAQFSPFELDTEEKPGIDAARLLSYPGQGWELDAVLADRGRPQDFSAALRASKTLPWADLYAAGGKLWNEVIGMGGVSAPVGSWKLRAEGVLPYDLDRDVAKLPRVTLGVDWLGGEIMVTGEYHFNGIGAVEPAHYEEVFQDPRYARGESYYLGRHYLGGLATWTPGNDRLSLTLSSLVNLLDPSGALTPVCTYDFGQSTRASVGGLVTWGRTPVVTQPPELRSEFGSYGDLFYTRLSIYF